MSVLSFSLELGHLQQLKPLSVAAITAESLLHESPGGLGASLPKCLIVGQVQEGVRRLIGIIAHLTWTPETSPG